ncbi:MAG: hypothetical protein D6767_02210 [Candidatus Hydrogenedentota bacterium]|nr:MAG: hypothetical protein D6767_02210 [Candidatus Hydrogenedentota bacterium]
MNKQVFLFLFAVSFLFAQNTKAQGNQNTATGNQTNQNTSNQDAKTIPGFDSIAWGTPYETVKERFRVLARSEDAKDPVEILRDVPEREILIKRRGIYYRYLFYKTPEKAKVQDSQQTIADNQKDQNPARFFFVSSEFDLVPAEMLYEKLKQKYGNRTGSTLDKNQRGAYIWEGEKGFLLQWLEPYQQKPYTRKLYYISKEIREQIKKDYEAYMSYRELKAIDSLLP